MGSARLKLCDAEPGAFIRAARETTSGSVDPFGVRDEQLLAVRLEVGRDNVPEVCLPQAMMRLAIEEISEGYAVGPPR